MKYRRHIAIWSALGLLCLIALSCGKDEVGGEQQLRLTLQTASVSAASGAQFISVEASGAWSLTIDGGSDWLSVAPASGSGNMDVALSYKGNSSKDERSATITLRSGSSTADVVFTQAGVSEKPSSYGKPSVTTAWMELPKTFADDGLEVFTHRMTVAGRNVRNYSYYWDYDNLVAAWVAYPLNKGLIGSGSRTNQWGLDPLLPRDSQPVLLQAYKDYDRPSSAAWGYSRGHQIASADRLQVSANIQTFYGTNMTPQDYDFNGNTWASLENFVRVWATQSDTLYVVTGCTLDGSTKKVRDNDGKPVTVPTGYYKALLRYMKSSTLGYDGYMGVGFFFENRDYLNSNGKPLSITKDLALSISDLEKKVGVEFFVNLPTAVGKDKAEKIKTQDPASVSWWW